MAIRPISPSSSWKKGRDDFEVVEAQNRKTPKIPAPNRTHPSPPTSDRTAASCSTEPVQVWPRTSKAPSPEASVTIDIPRTSLPTRARSSRRSGRRRARRAARAARRPARPNPTFAYARHRRKPPAARRPDAALPASPARKSEPATIAVARTTSARLAWAIPRARMARPPTRQIRRAITSVLPERPGQATRRGRPRRRGASRAGASRECGKSPIVGPRPRRLRYPRHWWAFRLQPTDNLCPRPGDDWRDVPIPFQSATPAPASPG